MPEQQTKVVLNALRSDELKVLRALHDSDPRDDEELAVATDLSVSDVVAAASKLEHFGLVERTVTATGQCFQLTDGGLARLVRAVEEGSSRRD